MVFEFQLGREEMYLPRLHCSQEVSWMSQVLEKMVCERKVLCKEEPLVFLFS